MANSDNGEPKFKLKVIPVTPLQQNASIVWSTEMMKAVVVDPGGDVDVLLDATVKLGVDVEAIWLTHGHIDHVGGATELKERLDCPIVGPHKADKFLLDGVEIIGQNYGIVGARNVQPDRWLSEGDTVELSGIEFEVLHCPGHSPGHIVFFQREAEFILIGDVLFRGSIGRTDLPGGDHEQLIRSITDKLWPLGNQVQFLPGHGPGSTLGQERIDNAFVADHVLRSSN